MGLIVQEYPSLAEVTTDPADVSFLLSLANDMRREKNDKLLEKLPESAPSDPHNCVIANAFNYGCEVSPRSHGDVGYIQFNSQEDRDTYLKVVGINQEQCDEWLDKQHHLFEDVPREHFAPLTVELNEIASDFDNGKRFVEYVVDDFDDTLYWLSQAAKYNNIVIEYDQ